MRIMKIRKLKWWLTGGILAAVAAVNFRVATDKESACAQLFAENVDAKANPFSDLYRWWINGIFDIGEGLIDLFRTYYSLDVVQQKCPDVCISKGTMLYGSEASQRLLATIRGMVEGKEGTYSGTIESGVDYRGRHLNCVKR